MSFIEQWLRERQEPEYRQFVRAWLWLELDRAPTEEEIDNWRDGFDDEPDCEGPPCGECHLSPGEVCDICGRKGRSLGETGEAL